MHPQVYLNTFWKMEVKPQVFVAMSFAPQYNHRYEKIIAPAIESLIVNGVKMEPYRVDISKSGDSILTEISEGIAHSQLILADVSSIGKDSVTGNSYRNGNVMYEVGISLSSRHPSEVLLIRDDHDKFLFDVSAIPHATIDFTGEDNAKKILSELLSSRLSEQSYFNDARVKIAVSSLTAEEITLLKQMSEYTQETIWGREVKGISNWYSQAAERLLDKRLIELAGEFTNGNIAYKFTQFGYVVHQIVNSQLVMFEGGT